MSRTIFVNPTGLNAEQKQYRDGADAVDAVSFQFATNRTSMPAVSYFIDTVNEFEEFISEFAALLRKDADGLDRVKEEWIAFDRKAADTYANR
jgi:hypothetical protein